MESCKKCNNCIADILKVIIILQKGSECQDNALDSCDRAYLGREIALTQYNTRPVVLYIGGTTTPLTIPISKSPNETNTTTIFRVEKMDECCATCRALIVNDDNTYTSTNSFCTININCICCIRCLDDVFIENV